MKKNGGGIRKLQKYKYELGHSVKEAIENINQFKGAGIVVTSGIQPAVFERSREVDEDIVINAIC